MRISQANIETALTGGHELRGLEVKGPGPATDGRLFAKVTRGAISMGNLRDGGHLLIGLDDKNLPGMAPGLSESELASWLKFDDVSQRMAEYVDPPLKMRVQSLRLATGSVIAVLEVDEFADLPHLCVKDAPKLRRGALYVRTRKMPQTADIASAIEMRELLDLATRKALRAFVETAALADVRLEVGRSQTPDDARFDAERERGWDE